MKKKSTPAWLTTFLLRVAGGINYRKLVKASKNPKQASEQTLRNILEYAKDTEFGRTHRFDYILAAANGDELYKRYTEVIAPSDYEDYRPYIDRHKQGEANVLVPGKPVMYATTSGTTKEPKWIPITDVYLKTVYGKIPAAASSTSAYIFVSVPGMTSGTAPTSYGTSAPSGATSVGFHGFYTK